MQSIQVLPALDTDRPRSRLSNGVLGMVFLLTTEVMFFAALISAYLVSRANAFDWPPLDQPRLPVEQTALNTLVLLASAQTMRSALRARDRDPERLRRLLLVTLGLGTAFVALQGYEWTRLLGFGLTGRSSVYGAFFYLIVGTHGLHVIAGLAALVAALVGVIERRSLHLAGIYWYFVVWLWPVLYVLVYVW